MISTFIFSDEDINSSVLTVLALPAFFKRIQEIAYPIIETLESLKNEVSNLPTEANISLPSLAIRYSG